MLGDLDRRPLVTVIVPVYRTPIVTLQRLLNSIEAQTYDAVEVVVVDDGNDEGYGRQLQRVAGQYQSASLVRKENGGVSSARNFGIRKAAGEFVSFADADDEMLPSFIEESVSAALEFDLDIVYGGVIQRYKKKDVACLFNVKETKGVHVVEGDQLESLARYFFSYAVPVDMLAPSNVPRTPFSRLFAKRLVCDIAFDERFKVCEDGLFNAEAVRSSARVGFHSNAWYVYYQYSNSAFHSIGFDISFYEHIENISRKAQEMGLSKNDYYAHVSAFFSVTAKAVVRRDGLNVRNSFSAAVGNDIVSKAVECIDATEYRYSKQQLLVRRLCRSKRMRAMAVLCRMKALVEPSLLP